MTADQSIYVRNQSTQVSDADVKTMSLACSKQIALHVAPAYGMLPVQVTFLAKGAPAPSKSARVITVMDTLDDPQALGYHTIDGSEHIWGVVGTKVAMAQGAKALTGPYSISSILSHEVAEMFIDPSCGGYFDNGHGLLIAYEVGDPVENDSYLIDNVSVSNFVTAAWFDSQAAKTDQFDHMGKLKAPFTMSKGGYWVQSKAGKTTEKFGEAMPGWRRLAKKAAFSRSHRRVREPVSTAHMARVRIVNAAKGPGVIAGYNTKVFVDDVNISSCVNDVQIHAGLKDVVTATLSVLVNEVEFQGELLAQVPQETREALMRLGWTPPSEPDAA